MPIDIKIPFCIPRVLIIKFKIETLKVDPKKIKKARKESGITTLQINIQTGLDNLDIYRLEGAQNPYHWEKEKIEQLAKVLEVKPIDLLVD